MWYVLSAMLDELDSNPRQAWLIAQELGIESVGLRMFGEQRFPDIMPDEWAWLQDCAREGRPKLGVASPGCNKGLFEMQEAERMCEEVLERCLVSARELGITQISLFSWARKPDAAPAQHGGLSLAAPTMALIATLQRIARRAAELGQMVTLEVGYACWGDTGLAVAELLERVDQPNMRMLWDPANSLAGRWLQRRVNPHLFPVLDPMEMLLSELAHVAPWIEDVHVRDLNQTAEAWSYALPGEGVINWAELMGALWAHGYRGALTLEHHMPNKAEASRCWAGYLRDVMAPAQQSL